jgi:hypothetical protein
LPLPGYRVLLLAELLAVAGGRRRLRRCGRAPSR